MKQVLYSLCVVSCLSPLLWAKTGTTAAAEGVTSRASAGVATMPRQCRPGETSPGAIGWRWKPGTVVKVYYLRGHFSEAEAGSLSRAVDNWNKALKEIGSPVDFVVSGEREGVVREGASITVLRGTPRRKERLGEVRFYAPSTGGILMTVTMSPVVTDRSALTSLLAHELGHSLGLADCYECRRGTTAMAAFKSNNKGNNVYQPSACDKYVVAAGYASETTTRAGVMSFERQWSQLLLN